MLDDDVFDSKADFSQIYDQPDPRAYFGTLVPLDYQIPQQALPVFDAVLDASRRDERPRPVLDVCCSYGINAALLRTGVSHEEIGARCADPDRADLPDDEVVESDRAFYAERMRRPDLPVTGLDIAPSAIRYGLATGLLTGGHVEDLEASDPSPELVADLHDVGLIVSTGGVGYVGSATFDRLVGSVADPADLWLAVFVLRVFPYDDIAAALSEYGLVTEQVPGVTFPQRRFADREEFDAANRDVLARGLDPEGKEADGWYHADCFLTRPAADAAVPLGDVLGPGVLAGASATPG